MKKVAFYDDVDYCEESQISHIRWAACKLKDGLAYQLTDWFRCRDFFNDMVMSDLTGKEVYAYGMQTEPKMLGTPSKTIFFVKFDEDIGRAEFIRNVELIINPAEERCGLRKTKLIQIENPEYSREPEFLVVGDPMWKKAPYVMSYYTLLLRIAGYGLYFQEGSIEDMLRQFREADVGCEYDVDNQIARRILEGKLPELMEVFATQQHLMTSTDPFGYSSDYEWTYSEDSDRGIECPQIKDTSAEESDWDWDCSLTDETVVHSETGLNAISNGALAGSTKGFNRGYIQDLMNILEAHNKQAEAA